MNELYHNASTATLHVFHYSEKEMEAFLKRKFDKYKTNVERTFYIDHRNTAVHLINLAMFLDMPFQYSFVDDFHEFFFVSTPGKIATLEERWEDKKKHFMAPSGLYYEKLEKEAEKTAMLDVSKGLSYINPIVVKKNLGSWKRVSMWRGLPIFSPDGKLLVK